MEKFLQNHKLTDDNNNVNECYLIEVFNERDEMVDMLNAYCVLDLLRVQKFYLKPDGRFWFTVKITRY